MDGLLEDDGSWMDAEKMMRDLDGWMKRMMRAGWMERG